MARFFLLVGLVACAATGWAASGREPYGGYVYPAGARQGTQVRVTVGGQNLQNARAAYFTGGGLHAKLIEHVKSLSNKQLRTVAQHLRVVMKQRWAEMMRPTAVASPDKLAAELKALDPLPDHPWLRNLDKKSLEDLEDLRDKLFDPKRQANAQLSEWALMDLTVDPAAAPGEREMRLRTPAGLSNPLHFIVGRLPEAREPERQPVTPAAALAVPVVLNGQIMPGEVDRFRLRCRQGQKLVVTTQARRLLPYLADAVPGWFQAVVALRDAQGKEVAYADDYRCDPDPVLRFEVPQEGEYTLEIRDAIYRGREDFVYRVTVGEQPFITSLFPLGGPVGAALTAAITGWNLPQQQVSLDTAAGGDKLRTLSVQAGEWTSNAVAYALDSLPEMVEVEPNDAAKQASAVALPQIVNGRISKPGDVDVIRFEGRAGEEIIAEVTARRLGSPLDSLLRLTDASGKVLALNDDHEDRAAGLIADQADSYLAAHLPATGQYYLQLSDARRQGGEEYAYRLRLSPPRPDFALRVTPSSLSVGATRVVPLTVYALRSEGFTGDLELKLKDAPPGFVLCGNRLSAGRDRVRMTLTVSGAPLDQPLNLQLEGQGQLGSATVTRPALPAEDMMQAFAYRHLVPARELMICGAGFGRWTPDFLLSTPSPVQVPAGGTAQVQLKLSRPLAPSFALKFQLSEAPPGMSLQEATVQPDLITFSVKADTAPVGYADNLIVEAFTEIERTRPGGKAPVTQRTSLGVLPAIPFEIVKQ